MKGNRWSGGRGVLGRRLAAGTRPARDGVRAASLGDPGPVGPVHLVHPVYPFGRSVRSARVRRPYAGRSR
ncbi:hypothetical protein GCM10009654_65860 [Streptomyces hebeiensis]|uniref:Uncharacterized protein n=1 Tax=Streptomyces hebeiensis TaxID=229486 RepID=A0ABN1V8T8_9ACTN